MNEPEKTTAPDAAQLTRLGEMEPGMRGTVAAFEISESNGYAAEMADRLREMGFAEKLDVEVLHESLFGRDPIAVKVGSMTIALRRREANIIRVQTI